MTEQTERDSIAAEIAPLIEKLRDRMADQARYAADALYDRLYDSISDYLLDNLSYNFSVKLHSLEAEISRLRARVAELEAALKPFAYVMREADYYCGEEAEDEHEVAPTIQLGDLRRARAALQQKEGGE